MLPQSFQTEHCEFVEPLLFPVDGDWYLVEHKTLKGDFLGCVFPPMTDANNQRVETVLASSHKLGHSNLQNVVDSGFIRRGGKIQWWVVIDPFDPARSLQQEFTYGPMTEKEGLNYLLPLVRALAHCEKASLSVPGLKPNSLYRRQNGKPVLPHPYYATLVDLEYQRKSLDTHIFDYTFTAPEVAEGGTPDHRASLYSLVGMLYWIVTGHKPADSDSVLALGTTQLPTAIKDPRHHRASLSEGFAYICNKGLRENRDERYQSGDELAADIEAALEGYPLPIRKKPITKAPQRPSAAAQPPRRKSNNSQRSARRSQSGQVVRPANDRSSSSRSGRHPRSSRSPAYTTQESAGGYLPYLAIGAVSVVILLAIIMAVIQGSKPSNPAAHNIEAQRSASAPPSNRVPTTSQHQSGSSTNKPSDDPPIQQVKTAPVPADSKPTTETVEAPPAKTDDVNLNQVAANPNDALNSPTNQNDEKAVRTIDEPDSDRPSQTPDTNQNEQLHLTKVSADMLPEPTSQGIETAASNNHPSSIESPTEALVLDQTEIKALNKHLTNGPLLSRLKDGQWPNELSPFAEHIADKLERFMLDHHQGLITAQVETTMLGKPVTISGYQNKRIDLTMANGNGSFQLPIDRMDHSQWIPLIKGLKKLLTHSNDRQELDTLLALCGENIRGNPDFLTAAVHHALHAEPVADESYAPTQTASDTKPQVQAIKQEATAWWTGGLSQEVRLNGSSYNSQGDLVFNGTNSANVTWRKPLHTAAMEQGQITIFVRAKIPEQDTQTLRRLVSISESGSSRNMSIGYYQKKLTVRLRTNKTGENGLEGLPQSGLTTIAIPNEGFNDYMVCYKDGQLDVWMNGKIVFQSTEIQGPISKWRDFPLVLGNENETTKRQGLDCIISKVAIFPKLLNEEEIQYVMEAWGARPH